MSEKMPSQNNLTPDTEPTSGWAKFVMALQAIGVGILIAAVVTIFKLAQHPQFRVYLGLDQMRTPLMVIGLILIAVVGFIVWYRPKLQSLIGAAAVMLVLFVGLKYLVRIDSYYGGMIPRFTWRWTPTAEERFAAYLTQQTPENVETPPEVSLQSGKHDFANFLGANRDGVIEDVQLDADWSARPPQELWRHPVGLGWGGFAVAGQAAITQEQRGPDEAVVCYDLKTGQELWVHTSAVRFHDEHGDGPRANPTVVDGRVYTMGATGLLTCLDGSTGKLIWQQQTIKDPETQNILWGMSGSPLVVEDLVVVTPGGGTDRALVAYQTADGREVFSGGDDPAAYSSPTRVQLAGQQQYLSFNGSGLRGFDAQGKPLWLHSWLTQGEKQRVNVAQPLAVTGLGPENDDVGYVLISSGYGMGAALLRISHDQETWQVAEVWKSRQLKSKMSNFVVRDGFIYGMDNGILTCLDLQSGKRKWKNGRYGHGQLLLVGDVLLIQAESGEVVLVNADPQSYQELARFTALTDKTWNNAALAGNILVVRNDREAAAFELPLRQESNLALSPANSPAP